MRKIQERPYHVAIDPGHGGSDPGAVSKHFGTKEKDITLPVGIFLRDIVVRGDFLYTPLLTRKDDSFVSLKCRCNKANLWGANVFVSIHCNARHLIGRAGIEIEVYHYKNSKRGREFANIVLGMLLRMVGERTEVISRGVKQGEFYVLKHTIMPAIIAELGFITDDEEVLFLREAKNQKVMASAIAEATELFLEGGEHEWTISIW